MRKKDPSWLAFTNKKWLLALSWSMLVGSLIYLAHAATTWLIKPPTKSLLGFFEEVAPPFFSWFTLGAALVLNQAMRVANTAKITDRETAIEKFFANRFVRILRTTILLAGLGFVVFDIVGKQFFLEADGTPALRFGSPFLLSTQILVVAKELLLPFAFLTYAVPTWIWSRRAAKANLSTTHEVDSATWIKLTRRLVRFFRWFMVVCVSWLFVASFLARYIPRANPYDYTYTKLLSIALFSMLGLYIAWVPVAIIRLRWLFQTEVGRKYDGIASVLKFVSWSTPITLAIAGLTPALLLSGPLANLNDPILSPLVGLVLQTNFTVLFAISAGAFVAVNTAYRRQIRSDREPATASLA
jgi:hypothetical protein